MKARIAIVGAGISGLVAARRLQDKAEVTVFERSRGPGGRVATRYADGFEFDHGAQFFTAKTPEFRTFLAPLLDEAVVADWQAKFVEIDGNAITAARQWDGAHTHFVGVPRMNAVGKSLAHGLDLRLNTRIGRIERSAAGWRLGGETDADLGTFDWIVLAAPAPQIAALDFPRGPLGAACETGAMRACFALLLGFDQPLDLDWHAALVRGADISWISVNSSKPGRPDPFTLVVHSTNAWADANIDADQASLRAHLIDAVQTVLDRDVSSARVCHLHRWRYANADRRDGPAYYLDRDSRWAACGDWFIRGRVEAAFTSGFRLSEELEAIFDS